MMKRPCFQVSSNQRKPLAEAAEVVEEEVDDAETDADEQRMIMAIREMDKKTMQAVVVALPVDFSTKVGDVAAGFPHRG